MENVSRKTQLQSFMAHVPEQTQVCVAEQELKSKAGVRAKAICGGVRASYMPRRAAGHIDSGRRLSSVGGIFVIKTSWIALESCAQEGNQESQSFHGFVNFIRFYDFALVEYFSSLIR